MSRTTRVSIRSSAFGLNPRTFLPARYTTAGSLVSATPDAEVTHYVRRRRSSAVGIAE